MGNGIEVRQKCCFGFSYLIGEDNGIATIDKVLIRVRHIDWLQRTIQLNYRVVSLGPDSQSIIQQLSEWDFLDRQRSSIAVYAVGFMQAISVRV